MKRIVLILTFLAIVIATLAQAPQKVSYQAVIRNSSGNLVTNRQVSLRISILKAVPMGSINNPINTRAGIIAPPAVNKVAVYTETHTATTNANGLVSIRIGDGTTTDSFSAVDWSAGTYYIKTEVDVNGGSNYVEIGNTQLLSVPYALYANEAGNIPDVSHFLTAETDPQFNAWNKDYNDLINTPEIPTVPTNVSAFINDANYITSADVPAQVNADWNATSGAGQILNKPELFSGNYNDLTNKPEIPTVPTNVSAFTNDANYITTADVPAQVNADWNATSGAGQILNKPTIPTVPTNVSAFTNDANYITSADVPAQVNADWNATSGAGQILNKPELFSGDYNDLANRPEIPTVPTNVSAFANDANYITSADVPAQVNADWNATSGAGQILNKPELFSGDYNDLTNRPEIPTVPTNVSAFTNDAYYITSADVPAQVNADWNATSGAGQILNKPEIPTVPTNVSAFTNDANYITSADVPAQVNADWNATSGAGQILNKPELFDGNYNNLTNTPDLSGYITTEVQTLTDVIALNNSAGDRQIKNVSDPTENQDAVTKKYVDELIAQYQSVISALQAEVASLQTALNATTITITFNANGGDGQMSPQILNIGVAQTLSENTFTKENYNFTGWNTEAEGSGTAYTDVQEIIATANMTLYAQWTPITYTVTFNANGGTGTMNPQTFNAGEAQALTSNTFTKENYSFTGWNTVADGNGTVYTDGQSITATADMTLYAQWMPCNCGGSYKVTDINGNQYGTVLIGEQCWMAENLRSTKFADGTNISLGSSLSYTTAYRYYPDNNSSNVSTYGYLYNWTAAMHGASSSSTNPSNVRGVCPNGWHLPSDAEWTRLTDYLSSQSEYLCGSNTTYIAKSLASTTGWDRSTTTCDVGNTPANNNSTGFSALPAGDYAGSYLNFGGSADFWSATEYSSNIAYYRYLSYDNAFVHRSNYDKNRGRSVRCVRD